MAEDRGDSVTSDPTQESGVRRDRTIQDLSVQIRLTLVEMRVDQNGDGEGKLSVATKIRFDKKKNVIELENFASEPVRLQQVKVKVTT